MKSHEVFQELCRKGNVKSIAADMGVSASTFYKWSEPGECHRINPLERVAALMRITGDRRPLQWLCEQADGYFVANPKPQASPPELMPALCEVTQGHGQMLEVIADASAEQQVTAEKAGGIRACWEKIKPLTEGFVTRCERGTFRRQLLAWFFKLYPVYDAATPGGLI